MENNTSISTAIINFNGEKTIAQTIDSIYRSKNINTKIYIIDDCSTDGSVDLVRKKFPEIKIIKQEINTKNLNKNRNLALSSIDEEKLFLTDNDILFDENCLYELNKVMERDNQIATCTPRLMYWDEPDKVYSAGTKVHYIGSAIGPYRNQIMKEFPNEVNMNSGSGILLMNREKALEAGGFDEDVLVMAWGDDGEFYQRLLRYGYKCFYVSSAFGYHEDKPFSGVRSFRAEGQIFNRWVLILSHYSLNTIIFLIPAFLVYEPLQFFFMAIKKMPYLYFRANLNVIKNFSKILKKRKEIQKRRRVLDKEVIFPGEIYISPTLLKNPVMHFFLNLLNNFFNVYWKLVKPFVS